MSWFWRTATITFIAVIGLGVYVVIEPVAIFGYDREALGESLEAEAPGSYGKADCRPKGAEWTCFIETDPGSGYGASYRLRAGDDGCWTAEPIPYGRSSEIRSGQTSESGCVGLLDVIGLDLFEI